MSSNPVEKIQSQCLLGIVQNSNNLNHDGPGYGDKNHFLFTKSDLIYFKINDFNRRQQN